MESLMKHHICNVDKVTHVNYICITFVYVFYQTNNLSIMRDRLLKFLNKEQLSSARFAEIIAVQPSSVSHILSGRNKPGFDFIQKMLASYPSVNADWLILGKGSMFKQESIQGNLFQAQYENKESLAEKSKKPDNSETGNKHDDATDHDNNNTTSKTNTNVIESEKSRDYKSNPLNDGGVTDVITRKQMVKIVIFYADRSFEEYYPENS